MLQVKLDKMKNECDKMAAQLSQKTQAHALVQKKYRLLRQELQERVRKRSVLSLRPCGYTPEQRLVKGEIMLSQHSF